MEHQQYHQHQHQQGSAYAGVTGTAADINNNNIDNNVNNIVQQVAQAALAMVRPHTDAQTRSAASVFLEDWTRTRESWPMYSLWLQESLSCLLQQHAVVTVAAAGTESSSSLEEAVGMILLCLQLLQGKIRREMTTTSMITNMSNDISNDLELIQGELLHLLSSSLASSAMARPILTSASICLAALVVRKNITSSSSNSSSSGGLTHFIQQCLMAAAQCYNTAPTTLDTTNINNNNAMLLSPSVAFCLLTNIPLEVEAAAMVTMTTSSFGKNQNDALMLVELRTHVENVLETCCRVIVVSQQHHNTEHHVIGQYAMEMLLHWTKTCRVSLAHFNTPLPTTSAGAGASTMNNDTVAVLPLLIHMLSSSHQQHVNNERLLVLASRALTEAILIPGDDNDNVNSRSVAVQSILQAIATTGFIAAPLHQATTNAWEDATHALAVLLCTFCTEEVDECCCCSSSSNNNNNGNNRNDANVHALLELLLQVQNHPNIKICCLPLECWLTIQEIPTQERHEACRKPLMVRVTQVLVHRLAYPSNSFTNWHDYGDSGGYSSDESHHVDVEQSDFDEFRRLVKDVLISCYFLLRIDFVKNLTQLYMNSSSINHNNWVQQEAALYALTVTSREVCARVKAHGSGGGGCNLAAATRIGQQDREETTRELLTLAEYICSGGGNTNNTNMSSQTAVVVEQTAGKSLVLLAAVCTWLGSYAAAWATHCSTQAILQMLDYLQVTLRILASFAAGSHITQRGGYSNVGRAAATAMKNILIACASKLIVTINNNNNPTAVAASMESSQSQDIVLQAVHGIMEAALSSADEEVMTTVTEGCTRVLIQLQDEAAMQQALGNLVLSVIHRGQAALDAIHADASSNLSEQGAVALDAFGKYLQVLQVFFRYCETNGDSASRTTVVAGLMNTAWPFLETVTQRMARFDHMMEKVLGIHEQLLANMPELVAPHFHATIKYVMTVFETTKNPSALEYMTTAVEVYGASSADAFQELLHHLSGVLFTHIQSHHSSIEECTELIKVYFELNQRFILYCPTALVQCPLFSSIINCAIECLTACKGERESTRAVLNFLDRLYCWRSLHKEGGVVVGDHSIYTNGAAIYSLAPQLDEQLAQHGARLLQAVMGILVGGPQMLAPAATDCIFSVVSWPVASADPNALTVAQEWLEQAFVSTRTALNHQQQQEQQQHYDGQRVEVYRLVVTNLLGMARAGPKNKGKAKMLLLDFSSVCKGESSVDDLVRYNRV